MTDDQLKLAKKYPDMFDNDNLISLKRVSNLLNMTNLFENYSIGLKMIGLENFKSDIRYIFGDIKKERKEKLKKLNNDNKK